jgi:hypothetical protein
MELNKITDRIYHLPAEERTYYRLTKNGIEAGEERWANPLFTQYPEMSPSHMKKPE